MTKLIPVAEGAGVGVTDEELKVAYGSAVNYRPEADFDPDSPEDPHADGLRAVLDTYGTTHPRPIPVAERLPTAADCDAEGRCWGWDRYAQTWRLAKPSVMANNWGLFSWLPAAAIPLPEATP
jgi:hypothetical protein